MIEIKGKYNTANVMVDEAIAPLGARFRDFVNNPSWQLLYCIIPIVIKAVFMYWVTMQMNDRIIPLGVGVDMCVGVIV